MTSDNPNLALINVNVITKFGFCPFALKILSGNEILTSIKGRNSVINLQNMMVNNPYLDLINVSVHTKFGQILNIHAEDVACIERKQNREFGMTE